MLEQGINIWGGEQFAPLFGAIKRYLTSLQSSLSQRYTFPTVTLTGDFEIELDIYATSDRSHILSDTTGHSRLFHEASSTKIVLTDVTGASIEISNIVIGLNVLRRLIIIRVGSGFTASLDGVNYPITDTSDDDFVFNSLGGIRGQSTTVPSFDGILANLKITNGTTLTHDLRFDEDFALTSIAVNKGTLGAAGNATAVNITSSELFTLHTETDPDEWRNFDDTIIIPIAPQA